MGRTNYIQAPYRKKGIMKNLKKVMAVATAMVMSFSLVACGTDTAVETEETVSETEVAASGLAVDGLEFMSYEEYAEAELDTEVTVLCMVQATQSWWENKITVYAQDYDGAYFIYNMACSEEDAANLVPGTTILVTGFKSEWSGEIEITDATFEFVDYEGEVFDPVDLTEHFGDEEFLHDYQNEFFSMSGLTVEAIGDNGEAFLYSYDGSGSQGDDLYFKVSNGETSATFTVESYLTGADTDVYQAVEGLNVGDTIDVEGFLYWYEGVNPHITSVTVR